MRVGFVTGPKALVDRIDLHSQVWCAVLCCAVLCFAAHILIYLCACLVWCLQATNLHASGISQALALKLLTQWGAEGWDRHIDQVSLFYARK